MVHSHLYIQDVNVDNFVVFGEHASATRAHIVVVQLIKVLDILIRLTIG